MTPWQEAPASRRPSNRNARPGPAWAQSSESAGTRPARTDPSRPAPTPGNARRAGQRGAADSMTASGNENCSSAFHQGARSGDALSTGLEQSKTEMSGQQLSAKASDEKCGEFPIRRTRRLISRLHPNQPRPLILRPAFVIGRNGTGIELHLLGGSTAHGYAPARPARKTSKESS